MHEGYEYQDYFTVSMILQLMICQTDAKIVIDRKNGEKDKFDDLKIVTPEQIIEYQTKYSDDISTHRLTKNDFSNGNGHDTAISDLFISWKAKEKTKSVSRTKLCLAWDRPLNEDPIMEYLIPVKDDSFPFLSATYLFDGEKFWSEGGCPPSNWKKFNLEILNGFINRKDFLLFCDEFTIVLEMPKASLDLKQPCGMESMIIQQVEKLGVGIYPNEKLKVEDIIYKLASKVKQSRANGNILSVNELISELSFVRNYGKFEQKFPVDSSHMVLLIDEMEKLYNLVNNSRRVAITGGPGSGKSWLVDQFINKLENDNFKVIRYNCYQSLQDSKSLDRIRITSLYGNLVSQIIEKYPELSKYKKTIFGANKEELENLLRYINDDLYLIVDGLDHISREYEINKEFITLSETKIISELLNIQFPNNCYVIISSQMIEEINEFKNSNYSLFKIEPWEIKQVENFMGTFQISNNDTIDGYGLKISEYLLKKSQGNPLYLNYILRQLRNLKIDKDLIDKIPDYDLDLSKYYSYLINKINNSRSVYALCGANFYLSIDELKEITGDGEFVSQDVLTLYPLLVENELNGGISIYHESFRRYILSLLQESKVDIDRNVYGLIAEWLKNKSFYKFDKSFYNLPGLLFKLKRDEDNINLIDVNFVLNSIAEGYSRKHIRINLEFIIRSASRLRKIVPLAMASELLSMLDDLNDFESTAEDYFQAVCDVKGASKLNQLMQIDGKPTYDTYSGLLACYISSKAGYKPLWHIYLDIEAKEYEVDKFKYYLRYYLDEKGIDIIESLMTYVENKSDSSNYGYIEIAYNELCDYVGNEAILAIAIKQHLLQWINYLDYIETGYYPQNNISCENMLEVWNRIKSSKTITENDLSDFRNFFSQIYHLEKNGYEKVLDDVCADCENINWFYNWVIYSVKTIKLYVHSAQMDSKELCEDLIENLKILVEDTDVFKGVPRTCDLYCLKSELTKSYTQTLELIYQKGTISELDKALKILEYLSVSTSTSLENFKMGPLTAEEFLKIIFHLLNKDNYENLKPFLLNTLTRIENNDVYDYVAIANLRCASAVSKYNKEDALEFLKMGTRYLVAYGYHKDDILKQIIDSYYVFFESVDINPIEERNIITEMAKALWTHTDGKGTRHFFNEWFDVLLKTDSIYALSFLTNSQIEFGKSWVVDDMILSCINKYCNNSNYIDIIIGLIKSLPNDTNATIIDASTSIIKLLKQELISANNTKCRLIKRRMHELAVNIVSRFNTFDTRQSDNGLYIVEKIQDFLLNVNTEKNDVAQYIDFFNISNNADEEIITVTKNNSVYKTNDKSFDLTTFEEIKKWIETNDFDERCEQSVLEFLKKNKDNNDILLEFLEYIIIKLGRKSYRQERKETLLRIIERLELGDKEMAKLNALMFLYSHDYDSSLIDTEEFIKGIELDKDVVFDMIYDELPETIISNTSRITKGLLNALYSINFNNTTIAEIWRNSFEIMKLRFPNLVFCSINDVIEEPNNLNALRNCLLMRFIDGNKEVFLATYSFIADMAEEENLEGFTDSMVFCLSHFKHYNLVTQLAIADLVSNYGYLLDDSNSKRIIDAIDKNYPTQNLLIDVIFSNYTLYKDYLLDCDNKHVPYYYNKEDMQFYLSEQLYDLGDKKERGGVDEYAKNSKYRDLVMKILDVCGIDYVNLYKKLHNSKTLNYKLQEFVFGSKNILEKNTVYKSYEIQYAIHLMVEELYQGNNPILFLKGLLNLIPNFQDMYRMYKCRDIQPCDYLYDKNNLCEPFLEDYEDNFVLIGSYEKIKHIDYKSFSIKFIFKGVVRNDVELDSFPFDKYLLTSNAIESFHEIPSDSKLLVSFVETFDKELEDEELLLPSPSVLNLFNAKIKFDFFNERYVGLNTKNEIVFITKKWSSCYNGDSTISGNVIPLYEGFQLFINKRYIRQLKDNFGPLRMITYVYTI